MQMFFFKIHQKLGREVVAICDSDILGKTFEEGDLFFEVKKSFYGENEINNEKVKELLMAADNFNIVGKKIVALALELNIIDVESIIKIKGVPHAQAIALW